MRGDERQRKRRELEVKAGGREEGKEGEEEEVIILDHRSYCPTRQSHTHHKEIPQKRIHPFVP